MKLRPLLLSVAVLAPLAAVVWWVQRPAPVATSSDTRLGTRLVDPAQLADAATLRITASGSSLEFTRRPDGRWVLAGEPALPADLTRLARVGSDLVGPKIERLVSQSAAKLSTYELDKDRVTYLAGDGRVLLDLRLGKTADGGGRLLAFGDESKAYLARLSLFLDASPTSWRDTALLGGVTAADIASIRFTFADGAEPVSLSREAADKPWTSPATPAGQQVKASVLTTQTGNLATLRYTGVTARDAESFAAARDHAREVTLTTFAGRTVTIALLRAPEAPAPEPAPVAEGETPPPAPTPAPRPVFVTLTDSAADAVLAEAGKTHVFEIADWIHSGLPARSEDLFEAVPQPPAPATVTAPATEVISSEATAATPAEPAVVKREPISVVTAPLSIDDIPVAPAPAPDAVDAPAAP